MRIPAYILVFSFLGRLHPDPFQYLSDVPRERGGLNLSFSQTKAVTHRVQMELETINQSKIYHVAATIELFIFFGVAASVFSDLQTSPKHRSISARLRALTRNALRDRPKTRRD